jgi:membrane protein YdbS with pleckstrin-like domain
MTNSSGTRVQGGEAIFRTRLHPVSCAGAWTLAGFVLFVGTLIVRHNELAPATTARVLLGSLVLALAATIGPLLRLRRSEVIVTSAALRVQLSAWREHVTEVPLRDLRSVDVRSTTLGRRFDFGTVSVVQTDGEVIAVPYVRRATTLRDALRRLGGRR